MNFMYKVSPQGGNQFSKSYGAFKRCTGQLTHCTGESLYCHFLPSSGDLVSRLLIPGTRMEFTDIPQIKQGLPGAAESIPVYAQVDANAISRRFYSEGFVATPENGLLGVLPEAQNALPNFAEGDATFAPIYPISPITELAYQPANQTMVGGYTIFGWPQFLDTDFHHPSMAGFSFFTPYSDPPYGEDLHQTNRDFESVCLSFAGIVPRVLFSSDYTDTYEFWSGLRSRVMAVGSGRKAFIACAVFDFSIADPEIRPGQGAIWNRQYFISTVTLVEDEFMLTNGIWKDIPITNIGGLAVTFLVIGESKAEWTARTGYPILPIPPTP